MSKQYHDSPPLYLGQHLYIQPNYIVSIPEYEKRVSGRTKLQLENAENLNNNRANGLLSKKATQRMKKAINWLMVSAKSKRVFDKKSKKHFYFKINFITLTIPSQSNKIISNSEFKEALHGWIVYMRKYCGLKNYVWKLECHQDGRLHIHITSDSFLHHRRVREVWNRIIQKRNWLDAYYSVHNHYDANSTDIHSVKNVKNLAAYMVKYMAKDSHLPKGFNGRVWGSNYELSEQNKCHMYLDPNQLQDVMENLFKPEIDFRPITSKPDVFGAVKQIGEIFFLKASDWKQIIKGKLMEVYDTHRFHIRHNIFKPPPEYFSIN